MIVAGVDYSITSPSVCVCSTNDTFEWSACSILTITGNTAIQSTENITVVYNPSVDLVKKIPLNECSQNICRYQYLANVSTDFIQRKEVEYVLLEDYSYASSGRTFHLGENVGTIKNCLYSNGIEFQVVPPTVVKKIVTGKGNANKDDMYKAFVGMTGVDLYDLLGISKKKTIPAPITDIVDAFFICKIAYEQKKGDGHG